MSKENPEMDENKAVYQKVTCAFCDQPIYVKRDGAWYRDSEGEPAQTFNYHALVNQVFWEAYCSEDCLLSQEAVDWKMGRDD